MHRSLLPVIGVLAGTLASGCRDNTGITDSAAGPAPSFAASVERFEAPWPTVFVDEASGLTLVAGATFDPQQLFDILCVGEDFTEVAGGIIVAHPSQHGDTVLHANIHDQDQSVIVWESTSQDICDDLVIPEVPPLAVGTARLTFTDNDFAGTSSHTDSFGQRIEGTVTNPTTGQRYHLTSAFRVVVLPDGTLKVPTGIFVQLKPIGG
jgi:hypothetical protein